MPTKIQTEINKLQKQLAEAEARVSELRAKLARVEARRKGETPPKSGLDLLWEAALPKSRERSSKHKCRIAWHRIPKPQRPKLEDALKALKQWNKCEEWTKEFNQFAIALDRWIKERRWEDVPQVRDPFAKYRKSKKPEAPTPEDQLSTEEALRILNED